MGPNCSEWVIVSNGFHCRGGQDKANAALANYLLDRGDSVTLVCQVADHSFQSRSKCQIVSAPRVANSDFLSQFSLASIGRHVANVTVARNQAARVIVNGGIFSWPDVNWMHCVHHAWAARSPCEHPSFKERTQAAIFRSVAKRRELHVARAARLLIANSSQTKRDLIDYLGIASSRVYPVLLGADLTWIPPSPNERRLARQAYGLGEDSLGVVFVGALDRDDHKGFGNVFEAWRSLCKRETWRGQLLVAGGGNQLSSWRQRARLEGLESRIKFLDFINNVPGLLNAADLLVSPIRYEAFGLNVQEAICYGVPSFVTKSAGVAERYPQEFKFFLLPKEDDIEDLIQRILQWETDKAAWSSAFRRLGNELRCFDWNRMAAEMMEIIENR